MKVLSAGGLIFLMKWRSEMSGLLKRYRRGGAEANGRYGRPLAAFPGCDSGLFLFNCL